MSRLAIKQTTVKLRDLFNKKRANWLNKKDYDVNQGKIDNNPASKILMFFPVGIVVSCLLIIIVVIGVPTSMDLVKAVLDRLVPAKEEQLKNSAEEFLFEDVKADSKFFDSLAYLKKNGVINGYQDNTFRPFQELTRAELLKTIVSAKKQYPLALNYTNCFKDVKNQWFAPAVCLAKEKGWISGYTDGSFHPNEILTKAEALKMILKAFDIKKTPDTPSVDMYEDVEKNAWYYQYIETALSRKLINENPNLEFYQPESPATRGYVAQIIYRVLQS
jgi:hypothetical protein